MLGAAGPWTEGYGAMCRKGIELARDQVNASGLLRGVKLEIRPTVHSSGYVDMEINQELSQAQPTEKETLSPTIFNRSISTTVSLKDGGSILLGGLVSSRGNNGQRGVPVLGTWQGIYVCEHRLLAHRREVALHALGD